jgi:3-deoxy-manno-octulosonate cytidylyltransferase (CMP-KDO synthetase)
MKVIGIIPARYGSTRFPGKPLALIAGKPLLQWVIEASKKSKLITKLIVATDDKRILELAQKCDVQALMTDSELPSGTDRIWAACKNEQFDIAINIQGDEPLITGEVLDSLVQSMIKNDKVEMATLGHPFKSQAEMENPNVVKIVLNQQGEALYFSRLPIPYSREKEFSQGVNLQHIGLYGYRKAFLQKFCETPTTSLERYEGLEQLRALYLGAKIQVTSVEYETRGVDTPEDVLIVERKLLKK